MNKKRIFLIDDDLAVRKLIKRIVQREPDIEVVGCASDPYEAREGIKQTNPDLLSVDFEMPRMNGLTFLRNLMRLRPMPVVMVSSRFADNPELCFETLEAGATDVVAKPSVQAGQTTATFITDLLRAVREAASVGTDESVVQLHEPGTRPLPEAHPVAPKEKQRAPEQEIRLIAIGASTGGTEAIRTVLGGLPADLPPIVIAQHIPPRFSASFAKRLEKQIAITVSEARNGEPLLPGHAYIAPGNHHLEVVERRGVLKCKVHQGPKVGLHRPAVNLLMNSVADTLGDQAMGLLLTGMGKDGASGLLRMRRQGAITMAQDKASSVVWGMPGEAARLQAADKILPITRMADCLLAACGRKALCRPIRKTSAL
ncbi:MAG: protein-glutamate methylesterase/protein-glutamine glutaminase [Gammaproteobacteria bacterium]